MAILQYRVTEDEVLHNRLTCPVNPKAKYTSSDIQNELLSIIGKQICNKLIQDYNNSRFFTLLADETTDKSTKEQVSLCLWFVDRSTGQVEIRE